VSNGALSKERIAEVVVHINATSASPPRSFKIRETILALIDERERLIAVAEAAEYATRKFGDQYEGRLGPLNEALAALDAWNAGT